MDSFEPRTDILPAAQRELWPKLRPIQSLGFVLYGGTAIALRLGHRQSVDFDFFSSKPLNRETLRQSVSFLKDTVVQQDSVNTLEVATKTGVKISFFGGLDFGRAEKPQQTSDGVLAVASMADLMATKLKVILQRSEAKDYQDIAAMARAGVRVEKGLAAAAEMFKPTFAPSESLKALVYFEGGDMKRLSAADRTTLCEVARGIKVLPAVKLEPDLSFAPAQESSTTQKITPPRIDPPSTGPRIRPW